MEHAQILGKAFADYLSALSVWGEDLTNSDGELRIYPGEDDGTKDGTRILCYVSGDMTETPAFTGNRWADVTVELKTPYAEDGGVSLALHQDNAAALQSALMDTGLVAALQTSAVYVYQALDRNPFQEADENGWTSGMKLRVYSVVN